MLSTDFAVQVLMLAHLRYSIEDHLVVVIIVVIIVYRDNHTSVMLSGFESLDVTVL